MPGARLWLTLIVPLLGASLFAQSAPPSAPAPNRQLLTGTWKLDHTGPPEDRRNWDRYVPPTPPKDGSNPIRGVNEVGPRNYEGSHIISLMVFGRMMLIESEMLAITLAPGAIVIDDDFREPTSYETNGRATTINVLRSYARGSPDHWYVSKPKAIKVSVKSSWNGDALAQELWTRDLEEIVRITRTFTPFDEGRKLLLVIKVLQPKLKNPVKDIERVYLRSSVPGPGSLVLWR